MSIFREYDVRGIVGKDLTPDVAQSIGRAYGTMARQRGCRTVALGRDGRLTSPDLRDRVLAGITEHRGERRGHRGLSDAVTLLCLI